MNEPTPVRITVPLLRARKAAGEKIVALTAYDYPTAEILDQAGVDILLVGDSLAMVVLGRENTLSTTMAEMLHHVKPVARAARRALVVADMPFLSFHISVEESLRNAGAFIQDGGARAVKIEGASPARLRLVEALVEAEIPVMGHVGLTPQSINRFGQFKMRGRETEEALGIVKGALALEAAGAFAVVLECLPLELAAEITRRLTVPTIGIGAGPHCDGQILVLHDLLGCSRGYQPKFVRRYADFDALIGKAAAAYKSDVAGGDFPGAAESYHAKPDDVRRLKAALGADRGRRPVKGKSS
jgi:3-methyl-2-oxobutanoate hydroxymethyltransferase